jgi:hypothetical protein
VPTRTAILSCVKLCDDARYRMCLLSAWNSLPEIEVDGLFIRYMEPNVLLYLPEIPDM